MSPPRNLVYLAAFSGRRKSAIHSTSVGGVQCTLQVSGEWHAQATDIALRGPRRGKIIFNFLEMTSRPAVGDDLGAENGVPETRFTPLAN